MNNNKERIGKRIADLRKEKGISQIELSKATGLTQSHISRIERGAYIPQLDTAAKIAKVLKCSVEDFLENML